MAAEGKGGGIVAVAEIAGVPLYEEGGVVFRLRQSMLDIGNDLGSVTCGAGLGGDFIELSWKGRTSVLYGRDLLKAWVATFEPDAAEHIPGTGFEVNHRPSEDGPDA